MDISFFATDKFRETDAMRFWADAVEDITAAIEGGFEAGWSMDDIATVIKRDGSGWGDMGRIEIMAEIVAPEKREPKEIHVIFDVH